MPQRDGQHLVGRRHLEIERARQLALEAGDVVIGDVAAVLAQVRGDAVGARFDGKVRGAQADRDAGRRAHCGWWRRGRC